MKCSGCGRKLKNARGDETELILCPACAARGAARGQGVDEDLANAVAFEATGTPGAALFFARFAMRAAVDYGAKKLAEIISSPPKKRLPRKRRKSAT